LSNFVIDIGNTRTKAALFSKGELVLKETWDKPAVDAFEKMTYNQTLQNIILSSTANVPAAFEQHLEEKFRYIRLDTETPLPITIIYQTPHTLGKDRIAAAVGADCLFPDENVLVIDAGTCITLDMVTANSEFIGGNISPGVDMRLKAMHHFTSKLPLVERSERSMAGEQSAIATSPTLTSIPHFLGDSTESAIRNGGELGALMEITGFMEKCRRRFKPLKVVFTGGDADFFVKNIKTKIFANPNLVLIGLNKILQYNVENF
jgi:type III pantothenate kinase